MEEANETDSIRRFWRTALVADAFVENLERVASAALSPAMIAWGVRRDQMLSDVATFKVTGKLEPDLINLVITSDPAPGYKKEFEDLNKTFFASLSIKQRDQFIDSYGVGYINIQLRDNAGMQATIHALLSSVVVESWTAFETLAADVWYAALKLGPEEWRKRTALKLQKKSAADGAIDCPDVSTISDPGWSYFSFVRDIDAASFQRLPVIKDWYRTTFGKTVQQKLFAADIYIDALSAVRML